MGEIKSTLDLVMARTRHLSMTAEEKRSQQRAEFEKRLQGLLQQYADGALSVEQVGERIAALQTETQTTERKALLTALVRRIDPGRDNARWLDLLAREAPALGAPLQNVLDAHRREEADRLASAGQEQLDRLARENGIAGTAVTPNPRQDAAFQKHLDALRKRTRAGCEGLLD